MPEVPKPTIRPKFDGWTKQEPGQGGIQKDVENPYQWSSQEPKLEVPTIYKAHVRPM